MSSTAPSQPEDYLDRALQALRDGNGARAALDELPVPVYVTDADGFVTYWNRACVAFAGREPQLGTDRWCVTWQLYTMNGEPMAHDECPMADAVRDREAVRDVVAIAERPDGSRVAFRPYPTPLFDEQGQFTGAVNLMIDVSDQQATMLSDQAKRCRRLAGATHDRKASEMLGSMAEAYDQTASTLREGRS